MKPKVTWLFVAFSCAFITVSLLRLPLQADEPAKVSSTTEPYHEFTLYGTRKITTETFKEYRVVDEKIIAKDPGAPNATWRSEHHVIYETLDGKNLKSAMTVENASATHFIAKQAQGTLFWRDLTGDETTVECNDVTHRQGLRFIGHTLTRSNGGHPVSGTGFKTNELAEGARFQEMSVASGKIMWTDVNVKPKDDTGCNDPKFPFQMLREKPLGI